MVWQSVEAALLAALELFLLWGSAPLNRNRIYLVSLLAALSPIAFLISAVTRSPFGGTLSDPNGIQPLRVGFLGKTRRIDMNLVAVILALFVLAAIVRVA